MKRLLLLAMLTLGVSCQKDYYLEDLDAALDRIEKLEGQISGLNHDLRVQIEENEAKAAELITLEDEILRLSSELDENLIALGLSEGTVEDLKDKILQLEALVISTNAQIEALLDELGIALLQTEQDEDLIADLVQQITILENKEPEIIIEYVEVIKEVEVVKYVTEYVIEYETEDVGLENISYYADHAIVELTDGQEFRVDFPELVTDPGVCYVLSTNAFGHLATYTGADGNVGTSLAPFSVYPTEADAIAYFDGLAATNSWQCD